MKKKLPWGEVGFLTVIVLCIAYYFFSVKGYGLKAVLWPYILMAGALLCVLFIAVELVRNASAEAEAGQTAAEKKTLGDWFKANSTTPRRPRPPQPLGPDGRGKENPRRLVQGEFPHLCHHRFPAVLRAAAQNAWPAPVQLPAELLPCLLPEQGKMENGADHRRLHHIGILSGL